MDLMKVARIPPVTATAETSVFSAVKIMAENKVGAIVVIDSGCQVRGIFTERDNLLRVTLAKRDPEMTLLSEVMTSPVDTAHPETSPKEALARMLGSNHRHLPVIDHDGRIVGMISVRQLLMNRVSEQHSNIDILAAYIEAGGPG